MTQPDTTIALVTGANQGIGFEIARQLAQKGVTVLLAARQLTDATHAANKIATNVMTVLPLKIDVTRAVDIAYAVAFVTEKFGRLDVLINNAGVHLEDENDLSIDILRCTFEVNTFAPFAMTQAFLPLLKKSKAGRIVNQSSIVGSLNIMSDPGADLADYLYAGYSSSKAALNMLMVIQSRQLKDTNIKVNAAHPGWVRTRMGGDEAPLNAAQGAQTAVRLALLDENGPTGGFFHMDDVLPW